VQAETRLRRVRRDQGRGLRELAREAQIDPGQLSRIERRLERPSPQVLLRLARHLGLRDIDKVLSEFYEDNAKQKGAAHAPPRPPRSTAQPERRKP